MTTFYTRYPGPSGAIGEIISGGTQGSVLFVGVGSTLAQDNSNFFWDDANNRLGIQTPYPQSNIQVMDSSVDGVANIFLTSNSTPSPYAAAASTEVNGANAAWKAFDGINQSPVDSKWTASTTTGWLRYDFSQTTTLHGYSVTSGFTGQLTNSPKTWTFEGSADASSWTVLDTQTNVASWSLYETRTYTLSAVASYRYFRINVSAIQGGANLVIIELMLLSQGSNLFRVKAGEAVLLNNSVVYNDGITTYSTSGIAYVLTTTADQLAFKITGGTQGTTSCYVAGDSGGNLINGFIIESLAASNGLDLTQLIFKGTANRGIRCEQRGGTGYMEVPEMQFGDVLGNAPTFIVSDIGTLVRRGTAQVISGTSATNAKIGGTIFFSTSTTGNSGSSATDLFSSSLAANTFATNGDTVEFYAAGTYANSINSKQVQVKFGSTTIFDSGALAITTANSWSVRGSVIRTGAATQKATVSFESSSSVLTASTLYSTASETLSGAVTLKVTATGTSNNDIVGEIWKGIWQPST